MTYQPKKGFFVVGFTTSLQGKSGTSGTIELDEFYTSAGQLTSTPQINGLAISETQADSISGSGPYFSQSPNSTGGFGADVPERLGARGQSGGLGCGIISSADAKIYFRALDSDRVLAESYIACYGGIV